MSTAIPETAASPVLRVAGLRTSFRVGGAWKTVVDDVSFDIGARETVAVVGESGSGKSVTALSIMRLVPEANGRIEGRIELEGTDLLALPEERMRDVRGGDIGMIFQEPMTSLNPVLTVGFQVSEALRRHRGMSVADADREALRLFDLVRIPDAARRFAEFPHTFSGGMRQRVMIAIALACRPKLLIADEPTTALDVTIQAQILELIRELQREIGMSVMFITHDMGVVAEIADRVVVMFRGEKVEEAPAARLFASPEHPYTRQLLTAVPKLGSLRGHDMPRRFPNVDLRRAEGELGVIDASAPEPADEPDRRGAPILEVAGLTTRFPVAGGLFGRTVGHVHAVEDVSFTLRAGETLALVGESGCGKSTTGRSILRLVEPAAGTVRFEGQDLMTHSKAELRAVRRRLQMIFQDPYGSLNPRKTVGAALREPIVVHGIAEGAAADRRVAELLQRVGLEPDHALRFPHEFSGGQRQRICIARSLALQPSVLVADESVSALDVSIKAQVINLMMELQAEMGLAYLFISHDIAVVERISHRVAVMYLGEIVEIGPRAAVLDNPQHPYTQRLISAVPVPDPSLRRQRGGLMTDEIKSPVRPLGWAPEPSRLVEVGPEHFVRRVG
ncbi:ATP-binding protein [Thalassobaculum fulvum]|uniref:Glutathione import ATP-binding protein GsiA n=1 Tax=Thalassobaculum fulvum TaxID=1633335 RepID=A0A918XSF6_9PROT|nr:ABC transporter ATP-binding protein [Thalassobaculum fulvum]GHD50072.1 ATP-binding protein [Thalassobaculum fulvum]